MNFNRLIVSGLILFALTSNAHAYIDPGTGSVVTTVILGFFAAIAYTFRKYVYQLKDIFSGKKSSETKAGQRDKR